MNDNYQLLANPYHLKKKKSKQNDLNDQIFMLLSKKFPEHDIDKKDYGDILKKIEFILIKTSISNTVNDTVDSIINYVIDGELLQGDN